MLAILQWSSVGSGFLAAVLWFASAFVRLPKTITSGWGGVGGTAQELGDKLRTQGRISAAAALFSGLSVGFQAAIQAFHIG